jgi:membrane protein required for colicin V production
MNWVDWAIVGIFGLSVTISLIRGFVREAMSLVVWAAAVIVAMSFYQRLAPWLVDLIASPSLRLLTSWLTLFVIVLILGGLTSYLLAKLIKSTGLSGTDRFLGVFFGIARAVVLVLVVLIVLPEILPVDEDNWWRESMLIPEFLRFESWARETATVVIDFFGRWF